MFCSFLLMKIEQKKFNLDQVSKNFELSSLFEQIYKYFNNNFKVATSFCLEIFIHVHVSNLEPKSICSHVDQLTTKSSCFRQQQEKGKLFESNKIA